MFLIFVCFTHCLDLPRVLKPGELYEGIYIPDKITNWTTIQKQNGATYYALLIDADIVLSNDNQLPVIVSNPKISITKPNSTSIEQTCY
jgi:hypothetical protein